MHVPDTIQTRFLSLVLAPAAHPLPPSVTPYPLRFLCPFHLTCNPPIRHTSVARLPPPCPAHFLVCALHRVPPPPLLPSPSGAFVPAAAAPPARYFCPTCCNARMHGQAGHRSRASLRRRAAAAKLSITKTGQQTDKRGLQVARGRQVAIGRGRAIRRGVGERRRRKERVSQEQSLCGFIRTIYMLGRSRSEAVCWSSSVRSFLQASARAAGCASRLARRGGAGHGCTAPGPQRKRCAW